MFDRQPPLTIAASLALLVTGCAGQGGTATDDAAAGDERDAGQPGLADRGEGDVGVNQGDGDPPDATGDGRTHSDGPANGDAFESDGSANGDAETDAALDATPSCSPFVTNVVRVDYGPGAGFGQTAFPGVVQGPPKGGGCCRGSLHVLSLGEGGSIVLELGKIIVDEPGPDFIVFENPFNVGGNANDPYAEPATVEVSANGVEWFAFPCAASGFPWGTCAGWHPVYANPDSNAIDPLDPAVSGGDPFDLADLAADGGPSEIKYVRIVDRPDLQGDFDLDAIAAVHGRCR